MIFIIDPAFDNRLEDLFRKIKEETSKIDGFEKIKEALIKIKEKTPDILIYHAGGSAGISEEKASDNIDKLLKNGVDKYCFIYLSDGPGYRDEGSEKDLKIISSVTDFANDIKALKNSMNNITYFELLKIYCKNKVEKKPFYSLQYLFLPLDIDMQALKILLNGDKKKESVKYLKEMLDNVEDSFFMNKFKEAKKLIKRMPEENHIYNFMSSLDKKKTEVVIEKELEEEFWKGITSFHDWYLKLATLSV